MLRVRDWSVHFENNRTRELKRLDWVPIPNKQDGDGYTALLDHPNGAAHLGAWLAIIQIASKCDVRGTLSREGARPHDSRSLARISRIPQVVLDEAIPRLLDIGWLEELKPQVLAPQQPTDIPQQGAEKPQDDAGIPQGGASEGKGMEGNGRGEKARTLPDAPIDPTRIGIASGQTASFVAPKDNMKPAFYDEQWTEFRSIATTYGMQCSDLEWTEAYQWEWSKLDPAQRMAAIKGISDRIAAGDMSLQTSTPKNYLHYRYWERRIKTQVQPMSHSERVKQEAFAHRAKVQAILDAEKTAKEVKQ